MTMIMIEKNRYGFWAPNLLIAILLVFFFLGCGGGGGEGVNSGASFILTVNGSNLSAKIDKAPLGRVLDELGKKANIKVYVDAAAAREGVSAEFKNLPLEEGIRRILKGRNYALTYAQPSASGSSASSQVIVGIRVVQSGFALTDDSATAINRNNEEGRRPLEEAMRDASSSSDPLKRASALRALGDHAEESKAITAIAAGLQDEDPNVRRAALEALGATGEEAPVDSIIRVALNDPVPNIRQTAFGLLIDIDERVAKDTLKRAMSDSDLRIRKMAQVLLKELQEEND